MTHFTNDNFSDFNGMRITVMGLGRFGGGIGVTRWLADQGAQITLTDLDSESTLRDSITPLHDLLAHGCVTLRLGGHDIRDFESADLIVANPAVAKPWENQFLQAATTADVPITTEIGLLVERLDHTQIIGVTGSAGKSTTAAMIHHILTRLGRRVHLAGNIGGSLLLSLNNIQANDWIVLELSSAMLHWLNGWSPATAVITNIAPNHIDWHGSIEHYEHSKLNITRFQQPGEHVIRGDQLSDDDSLNIRLRIPGTHNITNARTAIKTLSCALDVDPAAAALALDDFIGLPHRLQLVTEVDGLRFYNDSKSTTPEATVRAVESFPSRKQIHLIAGGYDKGADLSAIADLTPRLAGLYTIGITSQHIITSAPPLACVFACDTLERAVHCAFARIHPGDVLLLSPGCASWDQFTNFQQRGNAFMQHVKELVHQPTTLGDSASFATPTISLID